MILGSDGTFEAKRIGNGQWQNVVALAEVWLYQKNRMLVQPSPSRVTVSEEIEGLRISIPGKFGFQIFFFAVWISFWTFAGIAAVRSLLHHFTFFLCIWMVGWVFGEVFAGYSILYSIGGREVISVSSDMLDRRIEIFGIGVTKSYSATEMRNLRFQPATGAGKRRIASGLAFDYGAKTIRIAGGLVEAEAAELINRIQQRCTIPSTPQAQGSGVKFWQGR